MHANGYVYETFGIWKHFPVKLQVLLKRAETLDNALTAKCFIYDVELNPPSAGSFFTRFPKVADFLHIRKIIHQKNQQL